MPRMTRDLQNSYIIVNNSNEDVKFKILEEKLQAEIDKKQNALQAGDHIKLEAGTGTGGKDIISYSESVIPTPDPPSPPEQETQLMMYIYEGECPLEGDN